MNTEQVVDLLLNKENEISNKFHNSIIELLRLGYDTERGKEEISHLMDSIHHSVEEIERVLSR